MMISFITITFVMLVGKVVSETTRLLCVGVFVMTMYVSVALVRQEKNMQLLFKRKKGGDER